MRVAKLVIVDINHMIVVCLMQLPEQAFESQLVSKMCCFELIEILYSRLTKEDVNSLDSAINRAYCGVNVKTGKELTQAVTK